MTNQVWEKAVIAIVKGNLRLLHVKKNLQWMVAEILHRFKFNENDLVTHQLCADYKISSLKEDSNSSRVNQAHDHIFAKNDKKVEA